MATNLEIANLALRRIGEGNISAMNETSKSANVIDDMWQILVESELRSWPYPFAVKTAELTAVVETAPDFEYVYNLEADYLQYIALVDTSSGTTFSRYEPWFNQRISMHSEWEIRNFKLYCNYDEVTMKYIYDPQDTTVWDASFTDAFAWKLAAEIAVPISGRDDMYERAFQRYVLEVNKARQSSGAEARRATELGHRAIRAR